MKKIICSLIVLSSASINMKAQNVGIGTTTPKARLHVADSSVLFSAPAVLPAVGFPMPATGSGNRMMWYASKAAIRAGGVTGTHWDEAYIGKYSTAFGNSNRAAGNYATSVGRSNTSAGEGTFTAGFSNIATGTYATALGTETDAQAYGSLVIGRYNIVAGSTNSWVNSDPLLVVGNGYLQEVAPGEMQIVRQNALTIQKNGIANFHNDLRVDGTGQFMKNANVNGKLSVDTIENLKVMNVKYTEGTTPELNIVPLGVVEFRANYATNPLNNTPTTSYKNLAGNFVSSVVGSYDDGALPVHDAIVGIILVFNTARVGSYKEIIAVGHSAFNGIGASSNVTLSGTGTVIEKDESGKPIRCRIRFVASDLPSIGDFSTYGTYMFYGLK